MNSYLYDYIETLYDALKEKIFWIIILSVMLPCVATHFIFDSAFVDYSMLTLGLVIIFGINAAVTNSYRHHIRSFAKRFNDKPSAPDPDE